MRETSSIGKALKHWRRLRGLSQLELSLRADVSARHLSFIESGRSRPGDTVVLRLAGALALAHRDTNALLAAAGFSPAFRETPLEEDSLTPFRRVIELMLKCHEPFPALVLDRAWNVIDLNSAAEALFPSLRGARGLDALGLFYGAGPVREAIVNFDEVAWGGLERLRMDAAEAGFPPEMTVLIESVEQWISNVPRPSDTESLTGQFSCPTFRFGDQLVRTITTVTTFSRAPDITLQELRVEQIFPADAASEAFFRRLAGKGV